MAGGAYHAHADMETFWGVTLAAGTTPSDGEVDAITLAVEGVANGHILGKTGRTLANANTADAAATKAILMVLTSKYYKVQGQPLAAASSHSDESGSTSYFGNSWLFPEVNMLIALAASGSGL